MDRRQVYFRSHCFHTISEVSGEYLSTAQRKAGGLPSRFGGWTGGAWAVRGAETTAVPPGHSRHLPPAGPGARPRRGAAAGRDRLRCGQNVGGHRGPGALLNVICRSR
jgi:hypothetical protein